MASLKGSLLSLKVLGNFKLESETETTAVLTHDAIQVENLPLPWQYGGDIAANIILAAAARLPALSSLKPMSVHVDYVSPGDIKQVRCYHVEILRQSDRFVHTCVKIMQDENRCVAIGTVMFHGTEGTPQSLFYRPAFPEDCFCPDQLKDDSERYAEIIKRTDVSEHILAEGKRMLFMSRGLGLECRPVNPDVYFRVATEPSTRLSFWIRYQAGEIAKIFADIEKTVWSCGLLAYASDFRIMSSSLRQMPSFQSGKTTTLSHSMWFAPDCELEKPTDWMLYDTRVIMSGNNTVLCEGLLWNEKGNLLFSARQQGLVRPKL